MAEAALMTCVAATFGYALLANRVRRSVVTGPMLFLFLGLSLNRLGLVTLGDAEQALHVLAEITLVIVLFSDAAVIDLRVLRRRLAWPERMLVGGVPLAIALGFFAGLVLLPGWPVWEVALLAAILAPTDAALGQAVVTNESVPANVREALSVESGLNDGLALPAVLMFGCLAVGGVHDNVQSNWFVFAIEQIGLGALAGATVGGLGAWAMLRAARLDLTSTAFEGVGVLALAGLSYLAAVELGGNGFLAAFLGGLSFGAVMQRRCRFVFEFMETEGQLLVLGTFLMLGASIVPLAIDHAAPAWLILILLSLFLVRPVAIWLSLARSDAPPFERIFMGWFGPRGLATALFALLVVAEFDALRHGEEILLIAVLAVLISAVLHGVTAAPAARWLGRRFAADKALLSGARVGRDP